MSARINDELAPTYEQLRAERDALAVENAALKESAADLRRQAFNGRRNSHNCGPFQYSDLCESIIESTKVETPATDAALAAIRIQGVEAFADGWEAETARIMEGPFFYPQIERCEEVSKAVRRYIAELREAK